MKSPYSKVRSGISGAIKAAAAKLNYRIDGVDNTIDLSKVHGDISCSISFRIASELKRDANSIANEMRSKMGMPEFVKEITVENGFINFHLERDKFANSLIGAASDAGTTEPLSDIGSNTKVIFEYTSANPIHPLHAGQLRNALLGDSLSKIYEACGYNVEREDYIDDLGLQMVLAMWGYLHLDKGNGKKFDHVLGKIYVSANKHMESHDIKDELSKLAQLMEQDGTYESKLTREIAEMCVRAQYETLFKYRIYHDVLVWESDIVRERLFDKSMAIMLKSGFIERIKSGEYKDCIAIDLNKITNLPKEFRGLKENMKVLVRSNGTPTYVAKDIAFHMWKFGLLENQFKYVKFIEKQDNGKPLYSTSQEGSRMDFGNMSRAINIIDERQTYPQELLKLAFSGMGRSEIAENIIHLAYGRVELEQGALAGRKGTWIGNTADDLLEEAEKKAGTLIGSKIELSKDQQRKVAESVALSAIKFEFLKAAPEKTMVFSWKWALSFEGNSGPYAQYMHARAARILEDAPAGILSRQANAPKITDSEFTLVKLLSKSNDMTEKAAQELRPNVITEYINELASAFAAFYEKSPVLKADSDDEKAFRIRLVMAFKRTMGNMLELLGIDALERM